MALATIVAVKGSTYRRPGARLLVAASGVMVGERAARAALEQVGAGRSAIRQLPGGVRAFVEVLEPPLQLLVCGAGHDVIPLVKAASALGWKVVVADERERFLNAERFPDASGFVRVERPEEAASRASLDDRTYVMVMSHNYLRDKDYLRGFLGTGVAYIGLLGPRVRTERLLDELRREGVEPSPEDLKKMFGPAGLDVGSDGPEEIAQAVVAEILAVRRGRAAG